MIRKKYIRDATEEILLTHPLDGDAVDDEVAILEREEKQRVREGDGRELT